MTSWLHRLGQVIGRLGILLITTIIVGIALILVIRTYNGIKTRITTDNGIQEGIFVELGGIKQYLQIRGQDMRNPIVVFLHGGPASPIAYTSYYYQPELESDYTFVQWDQRGSGRTYYANQNLDLKTGLSTDVLLNDLDALVDYLTTRFGQDKVVIMGHVPGQADVDRIKLSRYVHPGYPLVSETRLSTRRVCETRGIAAR